ncbi:MAG: hypothetical protein QNK30_11320 [Bacteroidales bacterium]|nr:hypothetical protein [Bacteroidales bacterium]
MNEQKQNTLIQVGMWLAVLVGSMYGLLFTLLGYIFDVGPGSGMEGQFWKILLVAIPSILIAAYIGELIVRKLAQRMLKSNLSMLTYKFRLFTIVLIGCTVAFIVGFEVGYILGKITGTISGIEWAEILIRGPAMALIIGIPIALIVAIFYSVFVHFYLKAEN